MNHGDVKMKGKGFPIIGGVVGAILLPLLATTFLPVGWLEGMITTFDLWIMLSVAFIGFGIGAFVEQKIRK